VSRRGDPERILRAHRLGVRNRLAAQEMSEAVADRWCDAWEAEAARQGTAPGPGYWEAGFRWIKAQRASRRLPAE
jgi:hypothetical protein